MGRRAPLGVVGVGLLAALGAPTSAWALDLDGDAVSGGRDACPWRRETWNFAADADGCPDGVPLTVRVVDAAGAPVVGATVNVELIRPELPPGRAHTPLWCPPGETLDALNGFGGAMGSHAYAAAAYQRPDYDALTTTTGDDGLAVFAGVRPGVSVTVSAYARTARSAEVGVRVGEQDETTVLTVVGGAP